jgi:hypothetical protein
MAEKEKGFGPLRNPHTHIVSRGETKCSVCGRIPGEEKTIYLRGTAKPDKTTG